MKKFLLIFAAVAAMTACTGNTTGEAGNTDSTAAVTENAEQPEEQVVEVAGPGSIEGTKLTLNVPEGWKATTGVFDDIILKKKTEEGHDLQLTVMYVDNQTATEMMNKYLDTYKSYQKGADVKAGDKVYASIRDDSSINYRLYADLGENSLEVLCIGLQPEDPQVIGILETVKVK